MAREQDTGSLPGLGRAHASEALEASSASQQIQLGPSWASSLVDNPAHLQTWLENRDSKASPL